MRLFNLLLLILWLLLACPSTEAPGTSASESTGGLPSTGLPDEPSTGDEPTPTTSGPETTGTLSTSSSTGTPDSTGPPEPYCGDDVLDPDKEECDYGRDNSPTGPCTLECKNAVCGDGLLYVGHEECDLGPLGNLGQYGKCTHDCHFAARCGDGVVDDGFEQCDLGDDLNGTGMGKGDMGPCDATCQLQGRIVFVTSVKYTGDLGGLSGADLRCKNLATAAGLADANEFRAWLSDGFNSPVTRFEQTDLPGNPYILLDGHVVADSFDELVTTGPRTGISITETGQSLVEAFVWTNTSVFGEVFSPFNHCSGWLSNALQVSARLGYNALAVEAGPAWDTWKSERQWTSFSSGPCNSERRLYCFEDGPGGGG